MHADQYHHLSSEVTRTLCEIALTPVIHPTQREMRLVLAFALILYALQGISQDAKEIVRRSEDRLRGNTSVAEMSITTERPKWTRSMEIKAWTKGKDLAMILIQAPARDQGVTYLKRRKEVWNWIPSLERKVKLPPSMMNQSWMGTDFTNDDLVKESSAADDYTHKLLGQEDIGTFHCYKIEMIPMAGAAVVWEKVIVWIDRKDFIQLKGEFYGEDNQVENTMLSSDVRMLGGRLLPGRIEMIPAGKPGQKTVIVYKSLLFDKPLEESFFSVENMTKIR